MNGDGATRNKNLKAKKKTKKRGTSENLMDETEKPRVVSLAEAAAMIDPSHLADALDFPSLPDLDLLRFYSYFDAELYEVSFPWVKMFKETPLSTLINVPLSHFSTPIYEISVDWIKQRSTETLADQILWTCDRSLLYLDAGGDNAPPSFWPKSQAAHFVVLAMLLRCRPDSLVDVLPSLRDKHKYQRPDLHPLMVWMMAQASLGDLSTGLYSWMCNLLPLVSNNKCCPQSLDLVLQFAEYIFSCPEALTILVNGGGVMEGKRLVPLPSLEMLLRLTFPAPSARVETTERFEAIYPMLKEVALSPERAGGGGRNAMKQLFTFALTLTGGKGNPIVLTEEATSIAIRSLLENVHCFDHWDKLYVDNPEASVALLKKLVDEWNNRFLRLSSTSPSDDILTDTVNQTMESFRRKNKRAIAEGGANCSLYKEADKYCRLISRRLQITPINTLVLAAVGAAAGATAAAAALSLTLLA